MQRQIDSIGLKVKKGVIQDATFITSDPGHAKADKPHGDKAKTRRSKDVPGQKEYNPLFNITILQGFRLSFSLNPNEMRMPIKRTDKEHVFEIEEVVYLCNLDKSQGKWSVREHPISSRDILCNKRISRKRAPGKRPYAVIKNVFKLLGWPLKWFLHHLDLIPNSA